MLGIWSRFRWPMRAWRCGETALRDGRCERVVTAIEMSLKQDRPSYEMSILPQRSETERRAKVLFDENRKA